MLFSLSTFSSWNFLRSSLFAARSVSEREELPGVKGTSLCQGVWRQFPGKYMVGCAEKPAKSPWGTENPPKKRAESSQRKKTPNRKEAQDGRPGVHATRIQKGYQGLVFNRKIRFAT
jgi:hypothetical protein